MIWWKGVLLLSNRQSTRLARPCSLWPILWPVVPSIFGFMEDNFSKDQAGWEGWFQDDSNTLHLLCTLFLSLHQLHLRSSGIRSRRLGTPVSHLTLPGTQHAFSPKPVHWLDPLPSKRLPESYSKFLLAIYFIYGNEVPVLLFPYILLQTRAL